VLVRHNKADRVKILAENLVFFRIWGTGGAAGGMLPWALGEHFMCLECAFFAELL